MRRNTLTATAALCLGALAITACAEEAEEAEMEMAPAPAETEMTETDDMDMDDEAMMAEDDMDMAEADAPAPAGPPPAMLAVETVGGGESIDVMLPDVIDADTGEVDKRFTGYGDNVSPAIEWTPVEGAESYAVILQDPVEMANGSTFMVLHWAAYNIPGTSLPEGVPSGAEIEGGGMQIPNMMGNPGYNGMQPPANRPAHQYTYQVFALDTMLDLSADAGLPALLAAMDGHVIGSGSEVTPFSPPEEAQVMQGVSLPDDHPLLND